MSATAVRPTVVADLTWFEPLPKQREFIGYWGGEVYYAGGVGSGKTLSGAFKGLVASTRWPGTVGLVGRQSYRALEDTTKKVYLEGDDKPPVIPPELVRDYIAGEDKVVLHNDSEILFRSFQDHNIEKLLSLNLGWFHVDEATETSEKVLLTLKGRLRHPAGPRVGWGTTNPNGHDWVWKRGHPDSGEATAYLIVAPTEENTHLPADYVAELRKMPREWQKRFVDANFDTASGQIWDEWDRKIHVVPAFSVPAQWKRWEALDHGRRNPTAVLWFASDEDDFVLVEDGYYSPGLVSQHATAILKIRGERKYQQIVADPSTFVKGFDGQSVADAYQKHGIYLLEGNNAVAVGLNRVSELLTRQPDLLFPDWHPYGGTLGPDGLGSPRLFVLEVDGTSDLRREIPDYRWKDLSPAQEAKADQPEEPRKKDDHACFPAGTLVAAETGDVPIEQLRLGQKVWTRAGLSDVTAVAMTGERLLMRVRFSDGSELVGTADHPVHVDGRGFCRLDALRYLDKCLRLDLGSDCRTAKPGESGKPRTGRSRTAATSTIATATRSTTASRTWRPSLWPTISRLMDWFVHQLALPLLIAPVNAPTSGIALQLGAPGTRSTAARAGRTVSRASTSASTAVSDSSRSNCMASGSARTRASRSGVAARALMTRLAPVSSAARSSASTASRRREPALVSVQVLSVETLGEESRSAVYGLTVADEHEFFADGVLVSNCDALRYGVMARFPGESLLAWYRQQQAAKAAGGRDVSHLPEDPRA